MSTDNDQPRKEKYGEGYWMRGEGSCYVNFHYIPEVNYPKAGALVAASRLPKRARVLDYGCGMGAITAALLHFGYEAEGVDSSSWSIEHCADEAKGHVRHIEGSISDTLKGEVFDLVIAKDVFEHIPEDVLPSVVEELMRLAPKIIFFAPVTHEREGKYVIESEEKDETHVTRFTEEDWLNFFPYKHMLCNDVPMIIRGAENAKGYTCILLERDAQ